MDNENETSSSGGFGKDYHGQDAFGERVGGGIGGDGHESSFDAPDIDTTELSNTDSSFEGEANEVADSMRESIRGVNEETAENSNTGGSMDTSFQIGGIEEDKEKYQQELERAEEKLNRTNEWADQMKSDIEKQSKDIDKVIAQAENSNSISGKLANILNDPKGKVIDTLESLAKSFGYDDFDRNKIEDAYKEMGYEALRNAKEELFERKKADIDKTVKGAQGRRDNFKSIVDKYKSSTTDKTKTSFTDKMEPSTTEAKTTTDTTKAKTTTDRTEEDLDKELQKAAKAKDKELLTAGLNLQRAIRTVKDDQAALDKVNNLTDKIANSLEQHKDKASLIFNDPRSVGDKVEEAADFIENFRNTTVKDVVDLARMAGDYTVNYATLSIEVNNKGIGVIGDYLDKYASSTKEIYENRLNKSKGIQNDFQTEYDNLKASRPELFKSSFTDKVEPKAASTPSKVIEEAVKGTGENMKNAKTSPSDYLTKSNKDSTKEIAPNRNDFGNHAVDTLKGVTDRISGSVTADALGLKSIEEFARENGYNPEKLSTMKAYQSYQNKEIMKAIPGIVKQIGSYITERVKDAVDPSQLGERVRNTLARYNLATLIGAAILSIKSGAGLQASIDQALTMVDTEDQPAVSDYLEDVLNDEGTVNDLKTAFDDALAPEQNSDTNELDESVINIGRKDNTDYSGFNAGLGSSGTTSSDADVKVFIARNVKSDPILRKMISKIGK